MAGTMGAFVFARALVCLDFKPLPDNRTEVTLRNFGTDTKEKPPC
jgi:hypothetical protein